MVSSDLLDIVRCPTCGDAGRLSREGEALRCPRCGEVYPIHSGYVDLMPRQGAFDHTSDYVTAEEELAGVLDYRSVGPPLLAAGVRQGVLQRLLRPRPTDRLLDCGCGNGKFALWNRDAVALMVGLDPATLFAETALEQVDLVQGDARRLPFASESFDRAWSIDVFEHLTRADLDAVLQSLHSVLRPGGRLLIYSNTREPSPLGPVIDLWRRIGRWLRRRGWATPDRYARPKADHVKAIETYEDLVALIEEHGFGVVEVRFWNSLFTSLVEHVVMPVAERVLLSLRRRARGGDREGARSDGAPRWAGARAPRAHWRQRAWRKGPLYWMARLLTWLMGLDMALFGRMRSGTYFLLVERKRANLKRSNWQRHQGSNSAK